MVKNLFFSVFLLLMLLITGCKKDKRYSTWYIDGVEHSSNNVEAAEGKARSALGCHDASYRWDIFFDQTGGLPLSGTFGICHDITYNCACIGFYNDMIVYQSSSNNTTTLTASSVDGKASYHLPPTWSIKMDATDSVLISGTFNQP